MSTLYTITTNGQTYTGTSHEIAMQLNGRDASPYLLADTAREIEYHGTELEDEAADEAPAYTVVKDEDQRACEHEKCETLHRRFMVWEDRDYTGNTWGQTTDSTVIRHGKVGYHWVTETEWRLVGPDGYSVDVFATRREARAAAERRNRRA